MKQRREGWGTRKIKSKVKSKFKTEVKTKFKSKFKGQARRVVSMVLRPNPHPSRETKARRVRHPEVQRRAFRSCGRVCHPPYGTAVPVATGLGGAAEFTLLELPEEAGVAGEEVVADAAGSEGIVAQDGTKVTGFTEHGVNRAVGDTAGRAGTKPEAIVDALKNPKKVVSGVDTKGRPFKIFTGKDARVVVNPQTGRVVSVNPLSGAGAH